jgi:endonuclease/exonuclease/phosphatase family metal-dependent hydrolase
MVKRGCILLPILVVNFLCFSQLPPVDSCYINVCSFNVYLLGGVDAKYKEISKKSKDPLHQRPDSSFGIPNRISNCAELLYRGNFDLMVFQEVVDGVRGDSAIRDLTNKLNVISDKQYTWFTSQRVGRGMRMESMAFIYDTSSMKLINQNESTSTLIGSLDPKNRKFVKTCWKAGDFDFTLISCHFAWSDKDFKRRQADYKKLDHILHNPLEYSDDPDVVVVGDFNRYGGARFSVENHEYGIQHINYDSAKFRVPHVEHFDRSLAILKEVSENPEIEDPQHHSTTVSDNTMVYDMFWLTADVLEEYRLSKNEWNIDFGVMAYDEPGGNAYVEGLEKLSLKELKLAYSDHRPIWMRFNVKANHSDQ